MNKNEKGAPKNRVAKFVGGKGFYIALILCVAAIGISCYYLYSSLNKIKAPELDLDVDFTEPILNSTEDEAEKANGLADVYVDTDIEPDSEVTADSEQEIESVSQPEEDTNDVQETVSESDSVPVQSNIFVWPVSGFVLSEFSSDELIYNRTTMDWRAHPGIDIAADSGTQVLATSSGTVVAVEDDPMEGTCVTIDHSNGLLSRYTGLQSTPTVSVGDVVYTGDVIGAVGTTSLLETVETPHLHFEMTLNDIPVNPRDYLPQIA